MDQGNCPANMTISPVKTARAVTGIRGHSATNGFISHKGTRAVECLFWVVRRTTGVSSRPVLFIGTLHSQVHAGDVPDVSAPRGTFTLRSSDAPVVLVSAGIGLLPYSRCCTRSRRSPQLARFGGCTERATGPNTPSKGNRANYSKRLCAAKATSSTASPSRRINSGWITTPRVTWTCRLSIDSVSHGTPIFASVDLQPFWQLHYGPQNMGRRFKSSSRGGLRAGGADYTWYRILDPASSVPSRGNSRSRTADFVHSKRSD